ncbi:hypothetical protein VNI00_009574 [Paramarasmius palmivorus]|uniref:Uncharacterized protein n=1 Tax=Paramarasmius palmivorus TaxID=297713 RepID=A0AAW0CRG7_9AGAR
MTSPDRPPPIVDGLLSDFKHFATAGTTIDSTHSEWIYPALPLDFQIGVEEYRHPAVENRPKGLPVFYKCTGSHPKRNPILIGKGQDFVVPWNSLNVSKNAAFDEYCSKLKNPMGPNAGMDKHGLFEMKPGDIVWGRDCASPHPDPRKDVCLLYVVHPDVYGPEAWSQWEEKFKALRSRTLGPEDERTRDRVWFDRQRRSSQVADGARCYTTCLSYQVQTKVGSPAAAIKAPRDDSSWTEEDEEYVKLCHELNQAAIEFGLKHHRVYCPEEYEVLCDNASLNNVPEIGSKGNCMWTGGQLNLASVKPDSSNAAATETGIGDMKKFGDIHVDGKDFAGCGSQMIAFSDLPSDVEGGRIHSTELGVYVRLDRLVSTYFYGLKRHGSSPPIGQNDVPQSSSRWAFISYPQGSILRGEAVLNVSPNPDTGINRPLQMTTEMMDLPETPKNTTTRSLLSSYRPDITSREPDGVGSSHVNFLLDAGALMTPHERFSWCNRAFYSIVTASGRPREQDLGYSVDYESFRQAFTQDGRHPDAWPLAPNGEPFIEPCIFDDWKALQPRQRAKLASSLLQASNARFIPDQYNVFLDFLDRQRQVHAARRSISSEPVTRLSANKTSASNPSPKKGVGNRATGRVTRSSKNAGTSSKRGRSSTSKDTMLRGITNSKVSLAKYAVISSLKVTQKKSQSSMVTRRASQRLLSSKTSQEPARRIKTRSQTRKTTVTVPSKRKKGKGKDLPESNNKRLRSHVNSSTMNHYADRDIANPDLETNDARATVDPDDHSIPTTPLSEEHDQDFVDETGDNEMDSEENCIPDKSSDPEDMVLISDLCDVDFQSISSSIAPVPTFPDSNIPFLKLLEPHSIAALTSDIQSSLAALHQDGTYKDIQEIVRCCYRLKQRNATSENVVHLVVQTWPKMGDMMGQESIMRTKLLLSRHALLCCTQVLSEWISECISQKYSGTTWISRLQRDVRSLCRSQTQSRSQALPVTISSSGYLSNIPATDATYTPPNNLRSNHEDRVVKSIVYSIVTQWLGVPIITAVVGDFLTIVKNRLTSAAFLLDAVWAVAKDPYLILPVKRARIMNGRRVEPSALNLEALDKELSVHPIAASDWGHRRLDELQSLLTSLILPSTSEAFPQQDVAMSSTSNIPIPLSAQYESSSGLTTSGLQVFLDFMRASISLLYPSNGTPQLPNEAHARSSLDFFLPAREKAPSRQRITQPSGPFHPSRICTIPGLASAIMWRAIFYNAPAIHTLNTHSFYFHTFDDWDNLHQRHPSESFWCNPRAYGTATARSTAHAKAYWEGAKTLHDKLFREETGFVDLVKFIASSSLFPQLGRLTAYLLAVDLVYANVLALPDIQDLASLVSWLNLGCAKTLIRLGCHKDKVAMGFVELYRFMTGPNGLTQLEIQELGYDPFVQEHGGCKYGRFYPDK